MEPGRGCGAAGKRDLGQPQQQRDRLTTTGAAIAHAYPPDGAADDAIDQLIAQLGQVPWPKTSGGANAHSDRV